MTILEEEAGPILSSVTQAIEKLSQGVECIVVGSITNQAGYSPKQSVIAFLSACRHRGNNRRTIFVAARSYAIGSEMFILLHPL